MIVRKYGRRNRSCTESAFVDAVSDFSSQESPQDIYSFDFSSQDFDSESNSSQFAALPPRDLDLERKSKKPRKLKKDKSVIVEAMNTATLMETQEFGEMIEHNDEIDFALDGLRKGSPLRIRQASLLSLLNICETVQRRRLLRTNGTTKTIVDAVLGYNFDDSASNLAAAALLYVLTSDGQDSQLLSSPSCIRFFIRLLKPLVSDVAKAKSSTSIGSKLLALRKDSSFFQDSKGGSDATSAAITSMVQKILVSSKEINSRDGKAKRPELTPKWIVLLTLEKACSSTISLEDTPGTMRRNGGDFKEKFRDYGGLDAVVEVAKNCHSLMEGWLEQRSSSILESENKANLESLSLLLKCLRILENATFLSMDNQRHLLGMKGIINSQRTSHFFAKLILSIVDILSGVSMLLSSSDISDDENRHNSDFRVDTDEILSISSSVRCFSMEGTSSEKMLNTSQGSCSGPSKSSKKNCYDIIEIEDTQEEDPFAFHEDEFKPSKWEVLNGTQKPPRAQKSRAQIGDRESVAILSQQESSNEGEDFHTHENGHVNTSAVDEEKVNLLIDCLLAAVKVLMNLTNDNPVGCQQIAASGGLETLSSLIACHFPSFSANLPPFGIESDFQNGKNLRPDQESDFLVAILGLLVNLVEKNGRNRSRLAAASVSLPSFDGGLEDESIDVISLLCSIFLANQGAGEAAGEGRHSSEDEEDPILQGEKEAEKMIIEAYAALLLAFISTESRSIRNAISECLPDQKLSVLVPVLERFVEFHMALNMISPETHSTVLEVIESCRIP